MQAITDKKKIYIAKGLRKRSTDTEKLLWSKLRNRQFFGLKFRRQQVVGPYIVDFLSFELKLIIELDGSQHVEQQALCDQKRTRYLESQGFKVIRFWNNDVFDNINGVLESIPHPNPLQDGEGTLVKEGEV